MQRNWIGKSFGATVSFSIDKSSVTNPDSLSKESVDIYTTRPDTIMGVTYMVLAPEHSLVKELTSSDREEAVAAYIKETSFKVCDRKNS